MSWDVNGKTAVVTGANSGIGLVTARSLAEQGAEVVMLCRHPERGAEAAQAIGQRTGHAPRLVLCDFSDQARIRAAAAELLDLCPRIDLLVNNAGAYFPRRLESAQGLEMTFAVNHLGYFLLTELLRERLAASAPARIVNVSSRAHAQGRLDFDDLQWRRRLYIGMSVYGTTKLMNILFTRELARRLEGTGVTANCLHPGVIRTGFGRDEPGVLSVLIRLVAPFLMSPTSGAKTTLHVATSPDVEGVSGAYFSSCRVKRTTAAARDDAAAARLWEVSEALCQLRESGD